ncbi:MAG TPA: carboxypeptidase-like regulatory domain-containing protein [Vicinamibacteria bacterium]|jgi:hypothetical protein
MYLLLLSTLTGTVLDEANQPVEGAVVVILPASYRAEPIAATADARGRFEVELFRPGPFRVEAYASGYELFRGGTSIRRSRSPSCSRAAARPSPE